MKFKIIDDERLSIYLTCDELQSRKIDAELLKDPERLKELLCQVGEKSGFSVADSALEVEIIPILDGDLLVSIKRVEKLVCDFVSIAHFDDTEALICACGTLYPDYAGASDLYLYCDKYYLVLKGDGESFCVNGILSEFGTISENLKETVLMEHGKLICEQKCVEMFTKTFFDR